MKGQKIQGTQAKNLQKRIGLNDTKLEKKFSPKKYKYLKWTKRGDNDKECTTKGKTGKIQIRRKDHTSVVQALYNATR